MSRCTSGLAFRELDEAFRLTERGSTVLSDGRRGKNTQHTMLATLRKAIYARLAGYEDVNDADRLRVDAALRRVGQMRSPVVKTQSPVKAFSNSAKSIKSTSPSPSMSNRYQK